MTEASVGKTQEKNKGERGEGAWVSKHKTDNILLHYKERRCWTHTQVSHSNGVTKNVAKKALLSVPVLKSIWLLAMHH